MRRSSGRLGGGSQTPTLDARTDELYRGRLADFVPARRALARTLSASDSRRVEALAKPSALAWIVNQTYWHAHPAYEHALTSGRRLRAAQVRALQRRPVNVAAAAAAHRRAVTAAVAAAQSLGAEAGVRFSAETLRQVFDAVSLVEVPREPHGRFTKPPQPAGFEALTGVALPPAPHASPSGAGDEAPGLAQETGRASAARRERQRSAEERRRHAAIAHARDVMTRAMAAEQRTRSRWEEAKEAVAAAERRLAALVSE
jgi:hypothetical protein